MSDSENEYFIANENENKLSLPAKIALGAGIIGLVLGTIAIIYRAVKNQKAKK